MGSELQSKYQRLAQEYAKLRSHVDILKKAVKEEKVQRETLEESLREKTLALRKHVQESESLEFRNQQLTKRVVTLQGDLESPPKNRKKKVGVADGAPGTGNGVQAQELAAKIAENADLHLKIVELTQKTERTVTSLQSSVTKLENEALSHGAAMDELKKEHETKMEGMTSERAMLEAKLAKQDSELTSLKKALHREKELSTRLQESSPLGGTSRAETDTTLPSHYAALNVPIVDAKLQGKVLQSLRVSLELVTSFTTQLSTLHSYLEQRCKLYPNDTTAGSQMSVVNEKLCTLLHTSSSYTKPLVSTLSQYHDRLQANPYSQTSCSDLEGFVTAHHRVVVYLETLTPYLQLRALAGLYSTKITLEYQLPTSSQKLNTTNECIVSSLTGLCQTTLQLCGLLGEHHEVFSAALVQSTPATSEVKSSTSTIVQKLRQRATGYIRLLKKDCPETVPYTLALYNARCMSSSSENKETLSKQITSSQERIARLEQDKEQLVLDLQLLNIKYEKEQKKVAAMEAEISQLQGRPHSPSQVQSLNTSRSSLASNLQLPCLSGSVGSLSAQGEEPSDEAVREELIRKHFTTRIAELNAKFQEVDSKAAHYYAESRGLLKQLNHNSSIRNKLSQDLETARETIQQLQDQLTTTSSSYEKQLSAMSDHLCELNDKMLQQSEELDTLKKTKGKRWGKPT